MQFTVDRLEEVIRDQEAAFKNRDPGIQRDINIGRYLRTPHIVVISGVRRCGKSTLLRQFAERVGQFLYVNLDDERLFGFALDDFEQLILAFLKIYPDCRVLLMDEVQNVDHWERFVRRMHDEGFKVIITGSNAKLLSAELGTHLTGRYLQVELYPFSFAEYLRLMRLDASGITTQKKAKILKYFDNYLKFGGFPDYLVHRDPDLLTRTYEDILFRDIVGRFGIRDVKGFRQLTRFLFSNLTKEGSYHSLKNALGMKSAMSARSYVTYLEEAYMVFELLNYHRSLKMQYAGTKKFFVIDNGMRNAVSYRFSGDWGRMLENMVFVELKRRGRTCYFWREKEECDFVLEDKGRLVTAIQCACRIGDDNREREVAGLLAAMERWEIDDGYIITYNQEGDLPVPNREDIPMIPAWKWLLEKKIDNTGENDREESATHNSYKQPPPLN